MTGAGQTGSESQSSGRTGEAGHTGIGNRLSDETEARAQKEIARGATNRIDEVWLGRDLIEADRTGDDGAGIVDDEGIDRGRAGGKLE